MCANASSGLSPWTSTSVTEMYVIYEPSTSACSIPLISQLALLWFYCFVVYYYGFIVLWFLEIF